MHTKQAVRCRQNLPVKVCIVRRLLEVFQLSWPASLWSGTLLLYYYVQTDKSPQYTVPLNTQGRCWVSFKLIHCALSTDLMFLWRRSSTVRTAQISNYRCTTRMISPWRRTRGSSSTQRGGRFMACEYPICHYGRGGQWNCVSLVSGDLKVVKACSLQYS